MQYVIDKGFVNEYSGAHISHEIMEGSFDTLEEAIEFLKDKIELEIDSNYYYEINEFEDDEFEDTLLTIHSIDALLILQRTEMSDPLSSLIKERRQLNMLTQKELANLVGVDIRLVQYWEAGTRTPDGKNTLKLIEILKLNNKDVARLLE